MAALDTAYLIITGAGVADEAAPPLIAGLAARFGTVLTIPTPNAARVVDRGALARLPGHRIVESYFDAAILPRPPFGLVLVAPCGFNSLNKLAAGIADTLCPLGHRRGNRARHAGNRRHRLQYTPLGTSARPGIRRDAATLGVHGPRSGAHR